MAKRNSNNGDALREYFGLRGQYLSRLEERGFVDKSGTLTSSVIGSVFQPAPGKEGEWERHCQEHPNDPICLLGARDTVRLEELFKVREDYLDAIDKADLGDVQRGFSDVVGTMSGVGRGGSVGLVSPDDPNADDIINDPIIGPRARDFAARMLF